MKKTLSLILALAMLLALAACGNDETKNSESTANPTEQPTLTSDETPAACNHSFNDATCSAPKTCSFCGETSGNVADHHYENDECIYCGATDPNKTEDKSHLLYGSWYCVDYNEEDGTLSEGVYFFNADGICSSGGNDWCLGSPNSFDLKAYDKYWTLCGGGGSDYTYTYDGKTVTFYLQSGTGYIGPEDVGSSHTQDITVEGDEMYVYYDGGFTVYHRGDMDWESTNTAP